MPYYCDVMHNPSIPSTPTVTYEARVFDNMTVINGPVHVHSLSVRHKRTSDSSQPLQFIFKRCTRYLHICFTPFPIIPLRYISCLLLSVGSSLQTILLRNSRMLHRALLYEPIAWTLTNGNRSSVQSGLRRNMERQSYTLSEKTTVLR